MTNHSIGESFFIQCLPFFRWKRPWSENLSWWCFPHTTRWCWHCQIHMEESKNAWTYTIVYNVEIYLYIIKNIIYVNINPCGFMYISLYLYALVRHSITKNECYVSYTSSGCNFFTTFSIRQMVNMSYHQNLSHPKICTTSGWYANWHCIMFSLPDIPWYVIDDHSRQSLMLLTNKKISAVPTVQHLRRCRSV